MAHLLVDQLRFARNEFARGLEGVSGEEATRRFLPMNCISWMVGHLANQEQRYWLMLAQGKTLFPELNELVGYHKPASTPPLDEMWRVWREITTAADPYLDTLMASDLLISYTFKGKPVTESAGTLMMRNIYHYWFHTGEASAVRQLLGHTDLPDFVGELNHVPYKVG